MEGLDLSCCSSCTWASHGWWMCWRLCCLELLLYPLAILSHCYLGTMLPKCMSAPGAASSGCKRSTSWYREKRGGMLVDKWISIQLDDVTCYIRKWNYIWSQIIPLLDALEYCCSWFSVEISIQSNWISTVHINIICTFTPTELWNWGKYLALFTYFEISSPSQSQMRSWKL